MLCFLFSPVYGEDEMILPDTVGRYSVKTEKHQSSPGNINEDSIQAEDIISADTLLVDTIRPEKKTLKPRSPQKATILSAALPGLGQAYNHKYWKIPIIYSVGAGLYYFYDRQDYLYTYFRSLHEKENLDEYQFEYERASKRRGYAVIFMGILYVANIVDAMADAHFLLYDISNDLTVGIAPAVIFAGTTPSYGIGLNLSF